MNKMFAAAIIVVLIALFIAPAFAKLGDVDGDGKVDLKDLQLLAKAYGSKPGDANWDARCDFFHQGEITLRDLVTIGMNYGT